MRSLLFVLLLACLTVIAPAVRGAAFETVFADNGARYLRGDLLLGSDGNFYGTTEYGGTSNYGTVFKLTPSGVLTTLASFDYIKGSKPNTRLVEGNDGNFYGTARYGGESNYGTVFKVTPAGVLTKVAAFKGFNGCYPSEGLIKGRDGNLYGTTDEGWRGDFNVLYDPMVFKVTPAGVLTTLVYVSKGVPTGLVAGSDGNIYGMTYDGRIASQGGTSGRGTIFQVTLARQYTTLVAFDSFSTSSGSNPYGRLVEGSDGNFYGTTANDGLYGNGTFFKMTPAGQLTALLSFDPANGVHPFANLVKGSDDSLYGTTSGGGLGGDGTVIKVTPTGEITTIATFDSTNGSAPDRALAEGSDGSFYGITRKGGASGAGTFFKVTPAGALTAIAFLKPANGIHPSGKLLKGSDGNFYGMTSAGGANNLGTVFKVTPAGELTTLVNFNKTNGSLPTGGLVEGSDGNFYGTTREGGANNYGTVFKVTPVGELTTLVSFNFTNGYAPDAALIEASDGDFYGTTSGGGASGYGTIFKVTSAGELTTLISFNGANGSMPRAGLVEGSDGNFYGTTFFGGVNKANSYGTIFKMTPAGELATLVTVANSSRGQYPNAELVEGSDGNFYGTTIYGGASHYGTVFKVTPTGEFTTLASFNGSDGSYPSAALVEGSDGNFYGTAVGGGGANGYGTIYKVTPSGVLTALYSFDGVTARYFFDGATNRYPSVAPLFDADGKLYGTADQMVVWRFSLNAPPEVSVSVPSAVTPTSATLSGTVNANAADTTVTFEYGLTPAYGSSVVASPNPVTGTSATVVSAILSDLAPHTTYYFRLTAVSSNSSASTPGGSFTTAYRGPVATDDSFVPDANDFGPITLAVLANDSDTDGKSLIITGVTQGSFGLVTTDGATLTYTPGPGFVGRDSFNYTVSNGIDTAAAQVELQAAALSTRALFSQDSQVPGAGQPGSGIPARALFKSFGAASNNSAGSITFAASYGVPGSKTEASVFVVDPMASTSAHVARRGQTAPGTQGALFASFKDPLRDESGDIAFLAMLFGGDTTKANNQGLWLSSFSEDGRHAPQLVARTGAQPPGAPAGARWKSFTSVALASGNTGAPADEGQWSLAFTAFMAQGAGGVNKANDMGLWLVRPEGTLLALREGQTLQIGGAEKKLRSFAGLMALPKAPGQGNGVTSSGSVAVQAFFTDGSQALLRVSGDAQGNAVIIEALGLSGDPVAGTAETAAKFGIPAQSSSGATIAWLGSLSGKGSPAAIFERNLSEPELLKLLARKGDAAPGIASASFSTFRSVALSNTGDALFLGKVSGKGISTSSDEGLWWKQGSGESASLQLLAREGGQPPGVPEGARWISFTSLALSEGPYGPLFTAKLVAGAKGKGPGKITSANDQGLWAVDSKGELQLIVQEGQEVIVEGGSTPKTLKSFTVLSAVPGSPTQRRSFADDGQIVYRALFTDGSQAVVKVQLP